MGYSPWGHKELDTTERKYMLKFLEAFKNIFVILAIHYFGGEFKFRLLIECDVIMGM